MQKVAMKVKAICSPKVNMIIVLLIVSVCRPKVAYNVLQLPEGGDLEALHCQLSTNFDRSTKLDLTTEPPLLGRCC